MYEETEAGRDELGLHRFPFSGKGPAEDVRRWRRSPAALFGLMMVSIFSSEVMVMVVLGFFPGISRYALPLLDALLLSVLVFPLVYLVFVRPLVVFVTECGQKWQENRRLVSALVAGMKTPGPGGGPVGPEGSSPEKL